MDARMKKTLESMRDRKKQIISELESPDIVNDIDKMKSLGREQSQIDEVLVKYDAYCEAENQINEAQELLSDPDMKDMAKEIIEEYKPKLEPLTDEIQLLLLPKDPNDHKNVVMEIRGAAGGDEANIFAGDLYKMYSNFVEALGWKVEVLETQLSPSGGFTKIVFQIKGEGAYSKLKFESGVHRVQRVPKTETQGRVHTSTATVAVLPEAEEVDVKINNADLKFDTFRASGAGGQHVNTTDSAVRVTHIPTGIVSESQDGRSQHANKDKALVQLRTRIFEAKMKEEQEKYGNLRKTAVGSGSRSEKIRTYNYPQNRISDHRIGLTLQKLDRVITGQALQDIIDALVMEEQRELMEMANKD